MFENLSDRLMRSFKQLRSRGMLTESDIDQTISEVHRAPIDADIALPVARQFTSEAREKAYGTTRSKVPNPGQQVIRIVHEELVKILGGQTRELSFADRGPIIFMPIGLQDAGETTLTGRPGKQLREESKRILLVASDLQWPNTVQQFQIVGERAGVEVWAFEPGNGVGDPVHVAHINLNHAVGTGIDVVIADTVSHLGVDEETMAQVTAIRDVIEPREIMLAPDAMVGQDAVQTPTVLHDSAGFTGVVLSKFDGDARGGATLSVRGVTGTPALLASTGEGLDGFERFHADRVTGRIPDMGDALTPTEQAERRLSAEKAERMVAKTLSGELVLADFLSQLQQIKKLGSMKKMLGMIPDAAQMHEQIENFDEREADRVKVIMRSMTPQECKDVSILNDSRHARIARGPGTSVVGVNGLVKRLEAVRETMSQMGQAGRAMSGFGSMPGRGGRAKQKADARKAKADRAKIKKKAHSSNPAKHCQQELEALLPRDQRKTSAPGASFGASTQETQRPGMGNLPDGVKWTPQGFQ